MRETGDREPRTSMGGRVVKVGGAAVAMALLAGAHFANESINTQANAQAEALLEATAPDDEAADPTTTTAPPETTTTTVAPPETAVPPTPEASPSPVVRGKIYVLGDSLTQGAQDNRAGNNLTDFLAAAGWGQAHVDAAVGRPLMDADGVFTCCGNGQRYTGHTQVEQAFDTEWIRTSEAMIIALGTNDYTSDPNAFNDSMRGLITRIREINPHIRIVVPTIYLEANGGGNYAEISAKILGLADIGVLTPDVTSQLSGQLKSDGIHPNDTASRGWAETLTAAVGQP